jgi:hypothetical protein
MNIFKEFINNFKEEIIYTFAIIGLFFAICLVVLLITATEWICTKIEQDTAKPKKEIRSEK